jgi:hypothetical protein
MQKQQQQQLLLNKPKNLLNGKALENIAQGLFLFYLL